MLFFTNQCLQFLYEMEITIPYHLSGASPLPLDMGYLLTVTSVLCRSCSSAYWLSGASLPLDVVLDPGERSSDLTRD